MNSLSWMIYLAGVAENMRDLFMVLAGLAGFGTIACFIFGSGEFGNAALLKWPKLLIPTAVLFATLSAITPSKDTIYAIAASEMGEEVLKSPEATKARAALNAWLDKQIEKPEKQ